MSPALTWLHPDLEAALVQAGLGDLTSLQADLAEPELRALARDRAPLTKARTRRLYRIPSPLGAEDLFVKMQVATPTSLAPRKWLSYAFKPSPLVREAQAANALRKLGHQTPELLAYGARGRFPGTLRALLITRAVPGYTDLESAIENGLNSAQVQLSITAVEDCVAQLHASGFALGGARYRDFLIPEEGARNPGEVRIIDAVNFGRGAKKRARDQSHLDFDRARLAGFTS